MGAALKNRRFLVFGGAAALCVLFLLVSVLLQAKRHHAVSSDYKDATELLASLKRAVDGVNLATLRADDQALADELTRIERELPESEFVATLLNNIHSLALETGNNTMESRRGQLVTGKRAGPPAEEGEDGAEGEEEFTGLTYSEQGLSLQLQGSYKSAFDFVQRIGTLGKIISVDSVDIAKKGPGATWEGQAETTIRLELRALILPSRTGFPGEVTIKVYS